MSKKIIVKALAIAAILVSVVLFVLAGKGILAGNRTYDLFRKIRVDLKDVYTEMDDYDLDHVKDTYREAFSVVDQIDEIGGTEAQNYLNDVVALYGLLDTAEVTDGLVASLDQIGTRDAWNVLNESIEAINKANSAYTAVGKVGAENASSYLVDIESALESAADPEAAREQIYADYEANEDPEDTKEVKETKKTKREFFDFVIDAAATEGNEAALGYLKAVADAPDMTDIEFAQQQIHDRYTVKAAEDGEAEEKTL